MAKALPSHNRALGGIAMPVPEDTRLVQTRLPVDPSCLDRRAGEFLQGVKRAVGEARKLYPPDQYKLFEIGFTPVGSFIEINLYFQK